MIDVDSMTELDRIRGANHLQGYGNMALIEAGATSRIYSNQTMFPHVRELAGSPAAELPLRRRAVRLVVMREHGAGQLVMCDWHDGKRQGCAGVPVGTALLGGHCLDAPAAP